MSRVQTLARFWWALVAMGALVVALAVTLPVLTLGGASHNDAPLIAEDPLANNTDVYAFASTEPGRSDFVTIIANYIPMQEPGNGPTHYRFSDKVLYEIKVDVDGDGRANLTYQFDFSNDIVDENTFLYNAGPLGLPPLPTDPTSQYENLNLLQSYSLTEVESVQGPDPTTVLLTDARVAPARIGPISTGTQADYEVLVDKAIHPIAGGGRVFVGPRNEGFYADLIAAFDLLGSIRDPGFDTFSGFNVHTIALEIPKSRFADAGDMNDTIGVWASASRSHTTVLDRQAGPAISSPKMVQVSRLGNPLVNELLMPFSAKDLFNATDPVGDGGDNNVGGTAIADFIADPGSTQGGLAIVPLLNSLVGCAATTPLPDNGRFDLELVFLTGIDPGTAAALASIIPSLAPFSAGNQVGPDPVVAEMLRLNYGVSPSTSPSPLGLLGGDPAGYPNGRRVGDDVIDITLKAGAGGILEALGVIGPCTVSPLALSDNVPGDPAEYLDTFPYLGTPIDPYEHDHSHGSPATTAMAIGGGLLAGGIALGAVFTFRRRRSSLDA